MVWGETYAFEVELDPARRDVNQTTETTRGRIDGLDTATILRLLASRASDPGYDPDVDIDGNGSIDGADLAEVMGDFFGTCWNGSTWSYAACPTETN